MKETVLMGKDDNFIEIPEDIWKQHVAQSPQDFARILGFMTAEHHKVRYFVVKALAHIGKPIPPESIAEALNMPLPRTTEILDELEKNLFFLVRNAQGKVAWAFPVTADETPHRLTFSTGERPHAA